MKMYVTFAPADESGSNTLIQVVSEEEIIRFYGPYWLEQMKKKCGEDYEFDREACLEDFVVIHWATVYEDSVNILVEPGTPKLMVNNNPIN